tara:strand:- start:1655 stop:4000 length:2346 start_codon:yes stop_codon:yes gene_type:complete
MPEYITDGDQGFYGVNMRLDPALLSPGVASEAKNKRFVNGSAQTRPGVVIMPWGNKAGADYDHKVYAANEIVRYSGKKRRWVCSDDSYNNQTACEAAGETWGVDSFVATGITNGNFATDSVWTKGTGWDINGNQAFITNAVQSDSSNLYQDFGATVGHVYFVKFTIDEINNTGSIKVFVGHDQASRPTFTTVGTHECIVTSAGNEPQRLLLQANATFVGKISNVSVSEPANVQINATQGPISNNDKGPYFQRNSTNAGAVIAPLDGSGNVNSGWTELTGQRLFSFGTVHGVGVYSDPNSIEYLIVAASDGVYATREGMMAFKLNGLHPDGPVNFVQAFQNLLMFRGDDKEPYIMDDLDEGFKEIAPAETDEDLEENEDGTGLEPIPNTGYGAIYFQNRMLIPHSRDLVSASDFLNVTRYQPVLASFRINQGSADKLVALHKFDRTTVLCFKEQSIFAVRNIYGNLGDLVLDQLTSSYGCASPKSIVSVGRDVWFLSDQRGVCSLQITESGAVQGVDVPLSDPIQPLIDRINWDKSDNATAAFINNRYYLSVCLDDSADGNNNAVLVYDFLNQAWSGYDTLVGVKEWVKVTVWGKQRLCYLNYDGAIGLYDDGELGGLKDEALTGNQITQSVITDKLVTRGYNLKTTDRKHWHEARVNVQTLDSAFNTEATVDGAKETVSVKSVTFDRTKYYKPFYAADYDTTNVNDDFNTPYRQDYAVIGDFRPKTNGVFPDLHQESSHKLRLNERGRFAQVVVNGTKGSTKVTSIVVDGLPSTQFFRKDT